MNPTMADCLSRSAMDPSTIAVARSRMTLSSGTQIDMGAMITGRWGRVAGPVSDPPPLGRG